MRINWYIEDEDCDGETHYATTEGVLPLVLQTVYFHDENMKSSKGTVVSAHCCVAKSYTRIDSIEFPDTARTAEQLLEFAGVWVEKQYGGVMSTINPERHTIDYATQRGEVIVRMEKPVGMPEKKE